jgi:hypothetical protein
MASLKPFVTHHGKRTIVQQVAKIVARREENKEHGVRTVHQRGPCIINHPSSSPEVQAGPIIVLPLGVHRQQLLWR